MRCWLGRNDISMVTHRKCKRGQGREGCRNGKKLLDLSGTPPSPWKKLCTKEDTGLPPSPLVLLGLGWNKIAGQEGKQPHSQTQRSGNWGKGIFPSGPAFYSFARPLQGYQDSQGVWGQFPVRSPRMYPTHKSLNS